MCGRHGRGPTPQYLQNSGKSRANFGQRRETLVLREGSISGVEAVSDLVQVAPHFVQRRRRAAQRLGVDRGVAPRMRSGCTKATRSQKASEAEPNFARSTFNGDAFVGQKAHGHRSATLPSLAAAPLVAGRLCVVVGRHGHTAHAAIATTAQRAEGAETGTVSAAACDTWEAMQRGGTEPCPLPS